MNNFKRVAGKNSALIALLVIFILASFLSPDFLSSRNLSNILRQASIIGIISLGQCIVILMGGFDL